MIFMNPLSRNSRATGPKIRVPRGLTPELSRTTAALSSKRMEEPSGRRYACLVRTTTARGDDHVSNPAIAALRPT